MICQIIEKENYFQEMGIGYNIALADLPSGKKHYHLHYFENSQGVNMSIVWFFKCHFLLLYWDHRRHWSQFYHFFIHLHSHLNNTRSFLSPPGKGSEGVLLMYLLPLVKTVQWDGLIVTKEMLSNLVPWQPQVDM